MIKEGSSEEGQAHQYDGLQTACSITINLISQLHVLYFEVLERALFTLELCYPISFSV